ncbi:MAG: MBL fold metallo-hydrolase [Pirellulales bacterium]
MSNCGLEMDVRAVGENSDSGDCIVVRFGNLHEDRSGYKLILIDGGFADDGKAAVKFIWDQFDTNHIDLIISTHPDSDHINGIKAVLEDDTVTVGMIWMHTPWYHNQELSMALSGSPLAHMHLSENQKASLSTAQQVEAIARKRGIPVQEPFAGDVFGDSTGAISVLGPTEEYYESLVEELNEDHATLAANESTSGGIFKSAIALAKRLMEGWGIETLTAPKVDATSPRNNSSTILLVRADTGTQFSPATTSILLTADAGTPALESAISFAHAHDIELSDCDVQQVPHHGSRRNMGPTILDAIVGPKKASRESTHMTVFVSCAKKNPEDKHPNPRVTNAYMRRGAKVYSTAGLGKRFYFGNCPYRDGSPATPVPFYEGQIEMGDDE